MKKFMLLSLAISLILIHCGVFEPELIPGTLRIVLIRNNRDVTLQKTNATLNSVRCIVKRGSKSIYDSFLNLQGNSFYGEISGLEPGNDYSVFLYGYNNTKIITRGQESNVSVGAGQYTTVTIPWLSFTPLLDFPADGEVVDTDKAILKWNDVSGAIFYEIMVDRKGIFVEPLINEKGLTTSEYKLDVSFAMEQDYSNNTYYWRVRAKDSEGRRGNWSETWSFFIATDPVLFVTPKNLEFDSDSTTRTILISNVGDGTLNWSLSTDNNWITVSSSSGSTITETDQITVTTNSNGLSPGSYNGKIIVNSDGGTDTIDISVSVHENSILSIFPTYCDFGTNKISKILSIINNGNGTLKWSISDNRDWITVFPTSGTTSTETDVVTLIVNRNKLIPSSYRGAVTINSDGGTETVSVVMTVLGNKTFYVSPNFLNFGTSGTSNNFDVINNGSSLLLWGVKSDQNWITATTSTNINGALESNVVDVVIDRSGLKPGDYKGIVNVESNIGIETVIVFMRVVLQNK